MREFPPTAVDVAATELDVVLLTVDFGVVVVSALVVDAMVVAV